MSEIIKIIEPETSGFQIKVGPKTIDLLKRFRKLEEDEKDILCQEACAILTNCINPVNSIGSTTGIAVGYVQSGKTMSFTTLTTLALDNGFRIVIYFAGNKVNLLEQTTKRLKKDLLTDGENAKFFKVYQSPLVEDGVQKIKSALRLRHQPSILITVLKHSNDIGKLSSIFKNPEVKDALGNTGVLIIDDEADQASLNTYARKNSKSEDWEEDEFSSTYANILDLRASLANHSYIQYTATPQGPLLINLMDLLSPKFHTVLTPGKSYTGGKAFFQDNPDLIISIPDTEVYHHRHNPLSECPQSLIDALQLFLIGTAIQVNIEQKEPFLSMMIHADKERDASRKFHGWIKRIIDAWAERIKLPDTDPSRQELLKEFEKNYTEAVRRMVNPLSFNEVIDEVIQVMLDINIELVISSPRSRNNEIDWSNSSAHILIGAEMLNRGYTVEGLAVTYMPRYSVGKSNADTIQQRCRFFGYKQKYLDSCRVFLSNDSILEYREYVEHEEIMRTMLKEKTLEESEQVLVLSNTINPTRNNILSKNTVKHKLTGWRQMNALQGIDENLDYVSNFLSKQKLTNFEDYKTPDRTHRYTKLTIDEMIEFLREFKIMNMPDALRKSSTIQYLSYLKNKNRINHAYVIEMAYPVTSGRVRSLINEGGKLRISNIFSGRSTSGELVYPGDKSIRFEDSLCIQIHKIKLKSDSPQWANRIIYTLGIYYPEPFAHSFVGVEN